MMPYVKPMLAALAFSLAGTLAMHAQLGHTREQCEKYFGKALKESDQVPGADAGALFSAKGFAIFVYFLDGKAAGISYAKSNSRNEQTGAPIPPMEIAILLQENDAGGKWERKAGTSRHGEEWATPNGNRAIYHVDKGVLQLLSPRLQKRYEYQQSGAGPNQPPPGNP